MARCPINICLPCRGCSQPSRQEMLTLLRHLVPLFVCRFHKCTFIAVLRSCLSCISPFVVNISLMHIHYLELGRTNLNYRVLSINIATIFLSNDHSLHVLITWDKCHAWFHLYGISRPAWSAWKRNIQNEKFLSTVRLEPSILGFERIITWKWKWLRHLDLEHGSLM